MAYLHGDLLGSTGATTSGAGAVTATQRYTPFGAVRAGGGLPTAIDFTGQRRDGTGLLFYNARYYDPGLGRFVSADDIGVDRAYPQTRNRYSYVLNNPAKYTDPTGHCPANAGDSEAQANEYQQCLNHIGALADLGVYIDGYENWIADELAIVLAAIRDFYAASGWTRDDFARNLGGPLIIRRERAAGFQRVGDNQYVLTNDPGLVNADAVCSGCGLPTGVIDPVLGLVGPHHSIRLTNATFAAMDTTVYARGGIVHELTHRWSAFNNGAPAEGFRRATNSGYGSAGYVSGDPGRHVSERAQANHEEDFAESVTASIYPNYEQAIDNGFAGSLRNQAANAAFYCYGPGRGSAAC